MQLKSHYDDWRDWRFITTRYTLISYNKHKIEWGQTQKSEKLLFQVTSRTLYVARLVQFHTQQQRTGIVKKFFMLHC